MKNSLIIFLIILTTFSSFTDCYRKISHNNLRVTVDKEQKPARGTDETKVDDTTGGLVEDPKPKKRKEGEKDATTIDTRRGEDEKLPQKRTK